MISHNRDLKNEKILECQLSKINPLGKVFTLEITFKIYLKQFLSLRYTLTENGDKKD